MDPEDALKSGSCSARGLLASASTPLAAHAHLPLEQRDPPPPFRKGTSESVYVSGGRMAVGGKKRHVASSAMQATSQALFG